MLHIGILLHIVRGKVFQSLNQLGIYAPEWCLPDFKTAITLTDPHKKIHRHATLPNALEAKSDLLWNFELPPEDC